MKSDVISTTLTTSIIFSFPALSTAKLAQLVIVDSQLGSAAAATTLFTSNSALDIQPLNPTQLPVPGSNSSIVTRSSCDTVSLDVNMILARQDAAEGRLDMIAQAITTSSDAILAKTNKIQQNQIGTNELLAVTSEKVDSNGNMLLILQNNIEMLNVILDIVDDDCDGKKDPKKGRVGNKRSKTMDYDY